MLEPFEVAACADVLDRRRAYPRFETAVLVGPELVKFGASDRRSVEFDALEPPNFAVFDSESSDFAELVWEPPKSAETASESPDFAAFDFEPSDFAELLSEPPNFEFEAQLD